MACRVCCSALRCVCAPSSMFPSSTSRGTISSVHDAPSRMLDSESAPTTVALLCKGRARKLRTPAARSLRGVHAGGRRKVGDGRRVDDAPGDDLVGDPGQIVDAELVPCGTPHFPRPIRWVTVSGGRPAASAAKADPVDVEEGRDRVQRLPHSGIETVAGRPDEGDRQVDEQALEPQYFVDAFLGALAGQRASENVREQSHAGNQRRPATRARLATRRIPGRP